MNLKTEKGTTDDVDGTDEEGLGITASRFVSFRRSPLVIPSPPRHPQNPWS